MNYGIINNRRPQKGKTINPLAGDVRMREIAKQFGLDPKDFCGQEAQNVWNMLDDLAANDPKKYQEFINEQLANGPPGATMSNQEHDPHDQGGSDGIVSGYFLPKPGFVVKCMAKLSRKQSSSPTKKMFINCCHHEAIAVPKNPNNGKDVPVNPREVPDTSNLEIPLAIGKLRDAEDANQQPSLVIDVVFHSWVLQRCEWDQVFKKEVIKLATQWVQREANVTLLDTGKCIKSRYKGGFVIGSGNNQEILTCKFFVTEPKVSASSTSSSHSSVAMPKPEANAPPPPPQAANVMNSPSDLLKRIRRDELDQQEQVTNNLLISSNNQQFEGNEIKENSMAGVNEAKKSRLLIEEIISEPRHKPMGDEPLVKPTKSTSMQMKPKPKQQVIKKGFLNGSTNQGSKPLYPTGSSEGKPASGYVNLLHRSKVVDLTDPATQASFMASQRSFGSSTQHQHQQQQPRAEEQEQDFGDFEFDQLCQQADPDLMPTRSKTKAQLDCNTMNSDVEQLRQLFNQLPS